MESIWHSKNLMLVIASVTQKLILGNSVVRKFVVDTNPRYHVTICNPEQLHRRDYRRFAPFKLEKRSARLDLHCVFAAAAP